MTPAWNNEALSEIVETDWLETDTQNTDFNKNIGTLDKPLGKTVKMVPSYLKPT
jgi:hypothetical protein